MNQTRYLTRGKVASIALLCGLFATTPSHADWQYTRWGMSANEVVAASEGRAHAAVSPATYEDGLWLHLLDSTYEANGLSFNVRFIFDPEGRLGRVKLELPAMGDCGALQGYLANTYGPAEVSRIAYGETSKWWDQANGNVLILSDMTDLWCNLEYWPHTEPGTSGGL